VPVRWPATAAALALFVAAVDAVADEIPTDDTWDEEAWFAGQRGLAGQIMLGPGYRHVQGVHVYGADLELRIGAQTRAGGFYGGLDLLLARTPEGLFVPSALATLMWEAPAPPFRFGFGVAVGFLGYVRATNGDLTGSPGVGPRAHVAVDLFETERLSLFLLLRGGGGVYAADDDASIIIPDTALQLGLRFF
jgi:hypothetical protein